MDWTNKKPDVEGYYLSNLPGTCRIAVIQVFVLQNATCWYNEYGNKILIKDAPDTWLWYGPVPAPFKGFTQKRYFGRSTKQIW